MKRSTFTVFAVVGILALLAGCDNSVVNAPGTTGTSFFELSGTVLANDGTQGVSGALVQVLSGDKPERSATSKANGSYTIDRLKAGTYTIEVTLEGYDKMSIDEVVVPVPEDKHDLPYKAITMYKTPVTPTYTISGKILTSNSSININAAIVQLKHGGANSRPFVSPASSGSYSIPGVPSDTNYTIVVSLAGGYETATIPPFNVLDADVTGKDTTLNAVISSASVSGLVLPITGGTGVTIDKLTAGSSLYSVDQIKWKPNSPFAGSENYSAAITLRATANYKFIGETTLGVNAGELGGTSINSDTLGNILAFSVIFPRTWAASSGTYDTGIVDNMNELSSALKTSNKNNPITVKIIGNDLVALKSGMAGGVNNGANFDLSDFGVSRIDDLFKECKFITGIRLPTTLTSLDDQAFFGCESLVTVLSTAETPLTIGSDAFLKCGKLTVSLPGATTIGSNAFGGDTKSAYLPNVTRIGDNAFSNAQKITITMGATPPAVVNNIFNNTEVTLFVPSASVSAYEAWKTTNAFTNMNIVGF